MRPEHKNSARSGELRKLSLIPLCRSRSCSAMLLFLPSQHFAVAQEGRTALDVAKTAELRDILSVRGLGEGGKGIYEAVAKGDMRRLRGEIQKGTPTSWVDEVRLLHHGPLTGRALATCF